MSNTHHAYLIEDYMARYKPLVDEETKYYQRPVPLADQINIAALSRNSEGKRHSHQRRLPEVVLGRVASKLQRRIIEIGTVADFDELITIVSGCAVWGFGELAIYDAADRIGIRLGVRPEKVYLHAGTRIGARVLGLPSKRQHLEVSEFPVAFHAVEASDIENFLCIYKDCLKNGQMTATNGRCLLPRLRHACC